MDYRNGMRKRGTPSVIEAAAERLRTIALDCEPGAFIGSEDWLVDHLDCSRGTVRQVARLLEREGLLRVRRGISGGYFGARPDAGTIGATVSAYLETLDMEAQDVTVLASALWVEVLRKAAAMPPCEVQPVVSKFRARVNGVKKGARFRDIATVEREFQTAIFELTRSRYIQLLFDINSTFASRHLRAARMGDEETNDVEFAATWKHAKLMELTALSDGDRELATMAARYSRKIWHMRVWSGLQPPDTTI